MASRPRTRVLRTRNPRQAADRGFVPTPEPIVDLMVAKLFDQKPPSRRSAVLDPGCGTGPFIDGVLRWCSRHRVDVPRIVGVEADPARAAQATARFRRARTVEIRREDFLAGSPRRFDYVIGNPPYVPITGLSEAEKSVYRAAYKTAVGRFDLYLLFFEQALRQLALGGRLVFITPEKFLYVKTAEPLRRILASFAVGEILLVAEGTFENLVTYPTITTVDHGPPGGPTRTQRRDGSSTHVRFPADGSSLQPLLNGQAPGSSRGLTLADICVRVSCGVATGADKVFVRDTSSLSKPVARFAYPTISGRQLVPGREQLRTESSLLVPYDHDGRLRAWKELGALGSYLARHRIRLQSRTCAKKKPWYAFHDSAPLREILRPKLLCKDITAAPAFFLDRAGRLVPRHSVYYIVPKDPSQLAALASYLNSAAAVSWLVAHCQRAANGFLRLQSEVLKRLPVPPELGPARRRAAQRGSGREPLRPAHACSR